MAKERKPRLPANSQPDERQEKYIRIPAELWDAIQALGHKHERTVHREAIWALRDYARRCQEQDGDR